MNFKELFQLINLILPAISAIFTGIVCFITYRTYNEQFKQMRNAKLPNLKILSVESYKSKYGSSDSLYDDKYCRMFYGESTANISLDDNIATFDLEKPEVCAQIEDGFIEEIQSHIGKNNAYFTYFGSKPYIIINHASNKESFIIDHSNVKITLHNYGAIISAISIESVIVFSNPGMNIDPLKFDGDKENKISLSPNDNKEFVLFLDEVTTNLNNSLCEMSASTYRNCPEAFDLLRAHMAKNRLNYNKMEVKFCCWDMYNNETLSKVTFEYNGNFFISYTTNEKNKKRAFQALCKLKKLAHFT